MPCARQSYSGSLGVRILGRCPERPRMNLVRNPNGVLSRGHIIGGFRRRGGGTGVVRTVGPISGIRCRRVNSEGGNGRAALLRLRVNPHRRNGVGNTPHRIGRSLLRRLCKCWSAQTRHDQRPQCNFPHDLSFRAPRGLETDKRGKRSCWPEPATPAELRKFGLEFLKARSQAGGMQARTTTGA